MWKILSIYSWFLETWSQQLFWGNRVRWFLFGNLTNYCKYLLFFATRGNKFRNVAMTCFLWFHWRIGYADSENTNLTSRDKYILCLIANFLSFNFQLYKVGDYSRKWLSFNETLYICVAVYTRDWCERLHTGVNARLHWVSINLGFALV